MHDGYLLHCIDDGHHFANRTDGALCVEALFTSALLAASSTSRRRPSTHSLIVHRPTRIALISVQAMLYILNPMAIASI